MRLLLDQGLPRSTVHHLDAAGGRIRPCGGKGLATASDAKIIEFARQGGWIVVTLDADFHALLALSGAIGPSVVRIRIEGQRAGGLATLLVNVLKVCEDDLVQGATISVTENGARIRRLPLLR
jgi:predicted nuclease of predicted toxin-antitoxin system